MFLPILQTREMKRFEAVIDLSKQLISLSTALIGGSILVSRWLFEYLNETAVFVFFVGAIVCWCVSIIFGIFNIGATINLIEQHEKSIAVSVETVDGEGGDKDQSDFISVFDSNLGPVFGMAQQAFFVLGVIAIGTTYLLDKL